jgi:hypothetical protein
MKAIFGTIKSYFGQVISRVFITGVSPLSMNDVTSSFNIRYDITLIPKYECMCGLREEDIRRGLELVFDHKKDFEEEEAKREAIEKHLELMRQYYNGYKFRATDDGGVYCTNLCLDYLQRLLMGFPLRLVDPNNELSEGVLTFIGRHPDSITILVGLLESGQTPFVGNIQENLRLMDLANIENQSDLFIKSMLFYFGALTFAERPGTLCLPNVVVKKTIVERVLQLSAIGKSSDAFRSAINKLLVDNEIEPLCCYLEPRLKEWIKLGNLYDDRELVTKVMFQVSLSTIPNYFGETEVAIPVVNVHGEKAGFADLLLAETTSSSSKTTLKRFIFEFKCKGVNFLDLPRHLGEGCSWDVMDAKANHVEKMSIKKLLKLKCGALEKYDKGKTVQQILDEAVKQLEDYMNGLQKRDKQQKKAFDTVAFVVLTVGSRKLLWKRVQ